MKILLTTDGSKYGHLAAKKCAQLVSMMKEAEVRILSVVEPAAPIATDPFGASHEFYLKIKDESKKVAEESVVEIKKLLEDEFSLDADVKLETKVLSGSAKEVIVDEAKDWNADLIVVGSHGYGFWGRMLIGSVSDAVIHHAPCSVLVVKDPDFVAEEDEEE